MKYAYIRVSSKTQNIDRQLVEMQKLNIPNQRIYIDKASGKDFERTNYKELLKILKEGDTLIIKSIDRLGRNYQRIVEEWYYINKVMNVNIKVLDMPLLDTTDQNENLVGRFISDIVLQILSFVAENERENIRNRQAEGIKVAKAKGIKFGRPQCCLPSNFKDIVKMHQSNQISAKEAIKKSTLPKSTYYKYYKNMSNQKNKNR